MEIKIRPAREDDAGLLLDFIKKLAEYENRLPQVTATAEDIFEAIFNRKIAEAVIAEYKLQPLGFALFFYNFSTFSGKPGLYIEDLFVLPEKRNKGIGKKLLSYISARALQKGCNRIEWTVLDWNKPALEFYRRLGAVAKNEWLIYQISGNTLKELAGYQK